jgi:hypothetical protein
MNGKNYTSRESAPRPDSRQAEERQVPCNAEIGDIPAQYSTFPISRLLRHLSRERLQRESPYEGGIDFTVIRKTHVPDFIAAEVKYLKSDVLAELK